MMRTIFLVLALSAPPIVVIVGTQIRENQRYPRRFAEVIPHEVYRGGAPSAENIVHLKEDKAIRSVLDLTDRSDRPDEKQARETAERLGIRTWQFPMPGDGRGDFVQLDAAADVIADQSNRPLFFHCAAGKQRSNAAWAAYRMKHCGWTIERTLAELERDYDLDRKTEQPLCEHLAGFARWLAARGTTTNRSIGKGM
jgi:protein tyrosine/serine phosphatase